jgi:hypothetical protein
MVMKKWINFAFGQSFPRHLAFEKNHRQNHVQTSALLVLNVRHANATKVRVKTKEWYS